MSLVRPDSKSSLLPASRVASQMLLFPLLRPFLTFEDHFFLQFRRIWNKVSNIFGSCRHWEWSLFFGVYLPWIRNSYDLSFGQAKSRSYRKILLTRSCPRSCPCFIIYRFLSIFQFKLPRILLILDPLYHLNQEKELQVQEKEVLRLRLDSIMPFSGHRISDWSGDLMKSQSVPAPRHFKGKDRLRLWPTAGLLNASCTSDFICDRGRPWAPCLLSTLSTIHSVSDV